MKLEQPEWYEVPALWTEIEPWIADALAVGIVYQPPDILRALLCKEMKLWIARDGERIKACAVTQLGNYPRLRVCSILVIGGVEMHEWLSYNGEVEEWAKSQGCEAVEGMGRRGWAKVLPKLGWSESVTLYRKIL